MSLKDLSKKLHDTFVEDDPAKPAAKPAVPPAHSLGFNIPLTPGVAFGTAPAMAPSPFSVPATTVLDEAVYQKIFDRTNFDNTDVGRAMHRYFDALPDTLDVNTKFKTALMQAAKLDNITPDRVLADFDGLKAALQQESDRFAKVCDTQNTNEVVGRQQRLQQINDNIAKLTAQIADLQGQHTQVSGELVDAQTHIANAQTQMQLATTRRSQEIDQQKAQFAALLQH
ncbi:MAG: hypothetical protein WBA09_19435 [Candidatus Acidiferrum sp.]